MIRTTLFLAGLAACATDTSTGISAEDLTCPTDSTLTYASFGATLIADNCLSCHAAKQSPTLSTQAAVQTHKAAIIAAAVTSSRMPQSGSLSTDERLDLGEWLTCGAP